MKYRLASRSDHIGLLLLDRLCFEQPVPGMQWYDWLDTDIVHVLSVADQVRGFIVTRNTSSGVRILRMAVHPNHRYMGIGSKLIDTVLASTKGNLYTIAHEDIVFGGYGQFLNSNNFEAKNYVNRTKIKFTHTGCDPDPHPTVRRCESPQLTG